MVVGAVDTSIRDFFLQLRDFFLQLRDSSLQGLLFKSPDCTSKRPVQR